MKIMIDNKSKMCYNKDTKRKGDNKMYRNTLYHYRKTKMQKMMDELRRRKAQEKKRKES